MSLFETKNSKIKQELPKERTVSISNYYDIKVGDKFKLGNHYLMCGDATSEDDINKLVDSAKINMVFTDAPYGINIVGNNGKIGAGNKAKARVYRKVIGDESTDVARLSYNILKKITDRLILWGGNYFIDFLDSSDSWLIWDKRVNMGSNNFSDAEMAWCSFHTPIRVYHQLWNGMIRQDEHESRVHPTQKPVRILAEILLDFSSLNDTILDVFGGSGSTLIACEYTDRKCYMMELDPYYCNIIINRWENMTGKRAIKIN